jgi:hypothetical protein
VLVGVNRSYWGDCCRDHCFGVSDSTVYDTIRYDTIRYDTIRDSDIAVYQREEMASISALLEQTLDLIGAEDDGRPAASSSGKTAASMLLEEKQKANEKMSKVSTINFNVPKHHSGPASAIFDQISTSSVEAPKYWASSSKTAAQKLQKYTSAKSSKIDLLAGSSNKKSQSKSRGEDYQDRLNGKLSAKLAKQKMKNKLKGK